MRKIAAKKRQICHFYQNPFTENKKQKTTCLRTRCMPRKHYFIVVSSVPETSFKLSWNAEFRVLLSTRKHIYIYMYMYVCMLWSWVLDRSLPLRQALDEFEGQVLDRCHLSLLLQWFLLFLCATVNVVCFGFAWPVFAHVFRKTCQNVFSWEHSNTLKMGGGVQEIFGFFVSIKAQRPKKVLAENLNLGNMAISKMCLPPFCRFAEMPIFSVFSIWGLSGENETRENNWGFW